MSGFTLLWAQGKPLRVVQAVEDIDMQKQTQTRALAIALVLAMLTVIVFGFIVPASR